MMEHAPEADLSLLAVTVDADTARKPSGLEKEVAVWFELMRGSLLRYLLSIGLPPQDGDEVIQEAFLALFLHLKRGRSRRNLRGWLFRVSHNLALKRRLRGSPVMPLVGPVADPVDLAPNAEEQIASRQEQQRLLAVLRVLPEQDQRCLALRAEGLSYREIAEVLGISLGTVSALISRSLARLARAIRR